MEKYKFINKDGVTVGYLNYDRATDNMTVVICKNVDVESMPFVMCYLAKRGIYEVSNELTHSMMRDRVVPPERQNIGYILREGGLKEYNIIDVYLLYGGRNTMDETTFCKVGEEEHERE